MTKLVVTTETNAHGRTFLLVNGAPSYTSWTGEAPKIEVIGKSVLVDGQQIQLPSTKGVMDNRHRNWKRRA